MRHKDRLYFDDVSIASRRRERRSQEVAKGGKLGVLFWSCCFRAYFYFLTLTCFSVQIRECRDPLYLGAVYLFDILLAMLASRNCDYYYASMVSFIFQLTKQGLDFRWKGQASMTEMKELQVANTAVALIMALASIIASCRRPRTEIKLQ